MADLSPDEAIDRDLLVGELEAARFADTELREEAWNPLDWVYLIGDGLFNAERARVRPAGGPAGIHGRPAGAAARRARCRPGEPSSDMPVVRSGGSRPRPR